MARNLVGRGNAVKFRLAFLAARLDDRTATSEAAACGWIDQIRRIAGNFDAFAFFAVNFVYRRHGRQQRGDRCAQQAKYGGYALI